MQKTLKVVFQIVRILCACLGLGVSILLGCLLVLAAFHSSKVQRLLNPDPTALVRLWNLEVARYTDYSTEIRDVRTNGVVLTLPYSDFGPDLAPHLIRDDVVYAWIYQEVPYDMQSDYAMVFLRRYDYQASFLKKLNVGARFRDQAGHLFVTVRDERYVSGSHYLYVLKRLGVNSHGDIELTKVLE